jgi:hypothetical protein
VSGGKRPAGEDGPPLDVVQRWFQAVVTAPGGVEQGVASAAAQQLVPLGRGEVERLVRRSRRLTAGERLGIYAHAYYARLLECLGDVFPVLARTLGKELFESFAFEYLQRYPSRGYTLNRLGESFTRFLGETRPDRGEDGEGPAAGMGDGRTGREPGAPEEGAAAGWPDFMIDLATLEWAIAQVFDGPGAEQQPLLSAAELTSLGPERFAGARLATVPCLRLLSFRFPVNLYYSAARRAGPGEELALPAAGEERIALSRSDFVVRRYELSRFRHAMLAAIAGGATVGAAIAGAAEVGFDGDAEAIPRGADELAAEVGACFRDWTAAGFFLSLRDGSRPARRDAGR